MAGLFSNSTPLATTIPKFRVEPKTHALVILHYAFPIFLLSFFFVVFATWSIYAVPINKEPLLKSAIKSSQANGNGDATANGTAAKANKPKPARKAMLGRKTRAVFNWALVGVLITYVCVAYYFSFLSLSNQHTLRRNVLREYRPKADEVIPLTKGH